MSYDDDIDREPCECCTEQGTAFDEDGCLAV